MSNNDALLMIFERNRFYRRQYLLALGAFGLALLVILVLLGVLLYVVRNPTAPLYFATDNVGRLIEIVPVTQPNMNNDSVINWAVNAVEKTYSYDFVNYRQQFQTTQNYFTNYGWTKYMDAIKSSNNLVALTTRKLIIQAKVVGQPVIVRQGLLGGAYAWKIEMPVLMTNWLPPYDAKSTFQNALNVSIIIQRQPILQSSDGVGIVQSIASMATTPQSQGSTISNAPSG